MNHNPFAVAFVHPAHMRIVNPIFAQVASDATEQDDVRSRRIELLRRSLRQGEAFLERGDGQWTLIARLARRRGAGSQQGQCEQKNREPREAKFHGMRSHRVILSLCNRARPISLGMKAMTSPDTEMIVPEAT